MAVKDTASGKGGPQAKVAGPSQDLVEYRLVASDDVKEWEKEIEDMMNDNWQPCANLVVAFKPDGTMMLVREMVKMPHKQQVLGRVAVPSSTRRGH